MAFKSILVLIIFQALIIVLIWTIIMVSATISEQLIILLSTVVSSWLSDFLGVDYRLHINYKSSTIALGRSCSQIHYSYLSCLMVVILIWSSGNMRTYFPWESNLLLKLFACYWLSCVSRPVFWTPISAREESIARGSLAPPRNKKNRSIKRCFPRHGGSVIIIYVSFYRRWGTLLGKLF